MEQGRKYLGVVAHYAPDGRLTPRSIEWEDGRLYRIDRVLDARPMRSLKAQGTGTRYTVVIGRTRAYLYFEDSRWWLERM